MKKKVTVEQIEETLKNTKEAGIEIRANYILAMPNETPEKARRMVRKICKTNPDYVKFNVLTPFPGTKLYEEIKQGKWGKMEGDLDLLTSHFPTFVPYGYKDIEEVKKIKRYAFRKFYFRPSYIFSKLASIRSIEDVKRYAKGCRALI